MKTKLTISLLIALLPGIFLTACQGPRYSLTDKAFRSSIPVTSLRIQSVNAVPDSLLKHFGAAIPPRFMGNHQVVVEALAGDQRKKTIPWTMEVPGYKLLHVAKGDSTELETIDDGLERNQGYVISGLTRYDRPSQNIYFYVGAFGKLESVTVWP